MRSFPCFLALVSLAACQRAAPRIEGTAAGDCTDAADNDADGAFDCDDSGCAGSPDCGSPAENAAPSGAAVTIDPEYPVDDDELYCIVVTDATDPNGDPVTYAYAWAVNGADAGITTASVNAALTESGDTWACTVTASDGELSGTPASASVTVAQGNGAPSTPAVRVEPAAPTDDDVLNCVIETASVDPDGDPVTYAYAWAVNGADAGITTAVVNPSLTEDGDTWACTVTASDGERESDAARASVEIVSPCGAATFDGMSDHISVPHDAALLRTSHYTIEAWVRPNIAATTETAVAAIGYSSGGTGWVLYSAITSSLRPSFGGVQTSPEGSCSATAPGPLTPGTWAHLAGTYDGTTARLYVDGVLAASASCTPYRAAAMPLEIGRETSVLGKYFNGRIAEVAYFSETRSSGQVEADMSGIDLTTSTLLGAWLFEPVAGTVAPDSSIHGRDANVTGAEAAAECP